MRDGRQQLVAWRPIAVVMRCREILQHSDGRYRSKEQLAAIRSQGVDGPLDIPCVRCTAERIHIAVQLGPRHGQRVPDRPQTMRPHSVAVAPLNKKQ